LPGELLAQMGENGERHEQGQGVKSRTATLPTLTDIGVSKSQSSRLERAGGQIAWGKAIQRVWSLRGEMTATRLSAEQRRGLAVLATAGCNGMTQALLSAHGFDASLMAELVNRGLAILSAEKVRAGAS
jgi:hypothetical protein